MTPVHGLAAVDEADTTGPPPGPEPPGAAPLPEGLHHHELTIDGLAATTEHMELRYHLTPPLPQSEPDEENQVGNHEPYVFLALEALDDAGNEYLDS
jgi:hypothetical protein